MMKPRTLFLTFNERDIFEEKMLTVMLPSMPKPHIFKFSILKSWSKSMKSFQLNIFKENKMDEHIWKCIIGRTFLGYLESGARQIIDPDQGRHENLFRLSKKW